MGREKEEESLAVAFVHIYEPGCSQKSARESVRLDVLPCMRGFSVSTSIALYRVSHRATTPREFNARVGSGAGFYFGRLVQYCNFIRSSS